MHNEQTPFFEELPVDAVERSAAAASDRALSPSLRRTLNRLLLGESEKQIAHALGISPHTVHGYVKDLYARLGVHSRAELMARWIAESQTHRSPSRAEA